MTICVAFFFANDYVFFRTIVKNEAFLGRFVKMTYLCNA